jgi:hypothetical protein
MQLKFAAKPETSTETRQIVLGGHRREVGQALRAGPVSVQDQDDVVTQVVAKYGLEKAQAQRDVDAVMKGRQI